VSHGIRAALEGRQLDPLDPSIYWSVLALDVDVSDYRNRVLFATLVGGLKTIRIEQPITAPRGLPNDVSPSVREQFEQWGPEAWDVSWVSYDEFLAAVQRLHSYAASMYEEWERRTFLANHLGIAPQAILAFLKVYEDYGYATRLVFWSTPL
jgi:hypothetical protein